jgi:hypothetical protein
MCCALSLLFYSQIFGQFTLKGEFRPRFEYRGGYGEMLSKDEVPQLTISERARLSAYYQTGNFTFGFGIQDVRVWGDDNTAAYSGVPGSTASIDLNEGWIGMKIYPDGLIKIGRQYWTYEDERIFAQRSWSQSEIKYDAFLFSHNSKAVQVDVGLSWNNMKESTFETVYSTDRFKTLNFLYVKKNLNDWMYLSAFAIASGVDAVDTSDANNVKTYLQGTYGIYAGVTKGDLKALASFYYQNGRDRSGLNTSAYMFSAKADYNISKKVTIGAGIDYLSGTSQENDDPAYASKNHTFDVLYGNRHRYYGHLDYFSNLPKSTGNGGLMDIFIKLNWAALTKASLGMDIHYFSLQNDVLDNTSETMDFLAKGLGEEMDLYLSWDPVKFINIRGGYSCFIATDSMEKLQGVYDNARFPSWVWVMITAKPVFFDTAAK